jgi:serine protease Do
MLHQSVGSRIVSVVGVVLLFTACGRQSYSAAATNMAMPPAAAATSAVAATVPAVTGAPLVTGLPDFSRLVAAVGPAVVNITVVEGRTNTSGRSNQNANPFGDDDNNPFGDFFRRFGIPDNGSGATPRNNTPQRGEGSGFIVSSDGYILTNAHVVDSATKVTVKTTDRREFTAKVIGVDETSDVAVIKIEGKNLPVVRIGDASKVRAGEWVVAIGSPFGFDNSATAGIVSATARAMNNGSATNYVNFIQTDVAVNPGNSGGPLFNLNGEVIGINSQIYSSTGSYAGLSFAIPIDVATNVRDQLVKNGVVSRGRIGVSVQAVNTALAESYGLDRPRGAAVSSVIEGGPAAKAGIKPEDVILSVNGRAIENSSDLPPLIAAVRPGTKADLEVWRDKATRHISVTVEEYKDATRTARAEKTSSSSSGSSSFDKLGLTVRELTSAEKQQLKTSGSVVVEDASGVAAEADIKSGYVILRANGAAVGSVEDLRGAVRGGGTVRLLVQDTEGQTALVTVKPE